MFSGLNAAADLCLVVARVVWKKKYVGSGSEEGGFDHLSGEKVS